MKTLQTMACAIALAMPQLAAAQAAPETQAASTAASQLHFQSAFADYKPYEDVPVADWRQVNESVKKAAEKGGGLGGHGSPEPPSAESTAPGTVSAPSAGELRVRPLVLDLDLDTLSRFIFGPTAGASASGRSKGSLK